MGSGAGAGMWNAKNELVLVNPRARSGMVVKRMKREDRKSSFLVFRAYGRNMRGLRVMASEREGGLEFIKCLSRV